MQQIAERSLELKRPDGTVDPIVVRLWAPELKGEEEWKSRLDVTGPGNDHHSTSSSGVDGFQALFGALHQIPILLANRAALGEITRNGDPMAPLPEHPIIG